MAIPETTNALREAGWEYSGEATCRGCGERIEWWITPSGKNMPVSVKDVGTIKTGRKEIRMSHFSDCPSVNQFRSQRKG